MDQSHSNSNWAEEQQAQSTGQCQPQQTRLIGTLCAFIYKPELSWRRQSIYEFNLPMTSYVRNREYTPETLRTPQTLSYCCQYLMTKVLPLMDDPNWKRLETIEFINDRLRAVRCEAYIQGYIDHEMLERMIRFYVMSGAETGDLGELRATMDLYYSSKQFRYSPFMVLCLLLLSVDSRSYPKVLANLPDSILELPATQRSMRIANSLQLRQFQNYLAFLDQADYLQCCLLYMFCDQMRRTALQAFSKAQINQPLGYLTNLLFFDSDNQLLNYLQKLGYPDIDRIREQTKEGKSVFINLKIAGLQETMPEIIPKRLKVKLGSRQLVEIISQQQSA